MVGEEREGRKENRKGMKTNIPLLMSVAVPAAFLMMPRQPHAAAAWLLRSQLIARSSTVSKAQQQHPLPPSLLEIHA